MKKILSTDRVYLSEWELTDAPFLLKLVNTSGWLENIGDRNIHTIEEAEAYIKKMRLPYGSYGYGFYALRLIETDEMIGLCGITKRMGLTEPDLGFALMPQHEGEGYMYEISTSLLKHSFVKLGLAKVVSITTDANTRAKKLLERLGMKYVKDIKIPKESEMFKLYVHERKP